MSRLPAHSSDVFVVPLPEAEIFYVSETHQILSRIKVSSPSSTQESTQEGTVQQPGAIDAAAAAANPPARDQPGVNP